MFFSMPIVKADMDEILGERKTVALHIRTPPTPRSEWKEDSKELLSPPSQHVGLCSIVVGGASSRLFLFSRQETFLVDI
jgi:hypothetical protein